MPLACRVHAFVLAGGNGSRLSPLTEHQCKPVLPFGGDWRVIDFVLGNLLRSGVPQAEVLVQFRPQRLIEHVRRMWWQPQGSGPPFAQTVGPQAARFRGTAHAVACNLDLVPPETELVLVFGADHVYHMDVGQMVDFHQRSRAEVTVAALPVPLTEAPAFGIVEADEAGRAHAFLRSRTRRRPCPAGTARRWPQWATTFSTPKSCAANCGTPPSTRPTSARTCCRA